MNIFLDKGKILLLPDILLWEECDHLSSNQVIWLSGESKRWIWTTQWNTYFSDPTKSKSGDKDDKQTDLADMLCKTSLHHTNQSILIPFTSACKVLLMDSNHFYQTHQYNKQSFLSQWGTRVAFGNDIVCRNLPKPQTGKMLREQQKNQKTQCCNSTELSQIWA